MKLVKIKVVTNSREDKLVEGEPLVVRVVDPPEHGKANAKVVRLLSKHFDCSVRIVAGFKSKRKTVEIF